MSSLGESLGKIVRRKSKKPDVSEPKMASESQPSIYLKAVPLRELSDVSMVKHEVESGNILIVKVRPLADKSIPDIKRAVNELCEFVKTVGGDIARLGEERIVVTPSGVRIWRDRAVLSEEPVSTAA